MRQRRLGSLSLVITHWVASVPVKPGDKARSTHWVASVPVKPGDKARSTHWVASVAVKPGDKARSTHWVASFPVKPGDKARPSTRECVHHLLSEGILTLSSLAPSSPLPAMACV